MTFRQWQGASRCTSGPQPGTAALMQAIMGILGDQGAMNWGIYNCRTVRGGSTTSCHGEGRAGDVGFALGDPDGDRLRKVLVDRAWDLGIQCVIYERVIYSALSPGGRPYTGVAPHFDHIHFEHAWVGANNLTLTRARRILRDALINRPPHPARKAVIDLSNLKREFARFQQGKEARPRAAVKKYQMALNKVLSGDNLQVDGVVGPQTFDYSRRWEREADAPRADGVPGEFSLRRLQEESDLFRMVK